MYELGSPANWEASPGKHNLMIWQNILLKKHKNAIRLFTMQVTHHLQETSVLSKAMNLLQVRLQGNMFGNDLLHSAAQHELTSCVVGRPFSCVMTGNGEISFVFQNIYSKHNVIHLILEKWCHDKKNDLQSMIHDSACIELFHEYKCNRILY